jgi:hypothetical protein
MCAPKASSAKWYRTRREIDSVEVDESILENQITVRGGYRKPKVAELAIVQVWFLPYYLVAALTWQIRWFIKYTINKEEYSQEDKEYITRTFFTFSADTWEGLDNKQKGRLMEHEIWVPENEERFRHQQKLQGRRNRSFDDFDPE